MVARRCSRRASRSASVCGGIDRRRNIDTARSSAAGGRPRPSFRWQRWQARALKRGPRPSDEVVEAGDETQTFLKIPLPTLKSRWRLKGMLAEGCENESRLGALNTVALPADRRS